MKEVNWEKAFKMLLAANYMGVRLSTSDGHWWIEVSPFRCDVDTDSEFLDYDAYFDKLMDEHKVNCRSKVYGGPLQALARIDASMKACGNQGLLEGVYTDDWYMGDSRESNDGVTKDGKELK